MRWRPFTCLWLIVLFPALLFCCLHPHFSSKSSTQHPASQNTRPTDPSTINYQLSTFAARPPPPDPPPPTLSHRPPAHPPPPAPAPFSQPSTLNSQPPPLPPAQHPQIPRPTRPQRQSHPPGERPARHRPAYRPPHSRLSPRAGRSRHLHRSGACPPRRRLSRTFEGSPRQRHLLHSQQRLSRPRQRRHRARVVGPSPGPSSFALRTLLQTENRPARTGPWPEAPPRQHHPQPPPFPRRPRLHPRRVEQTTRPSPQRRTLPLRPRPQSGP